MNRRATLLAGLALGLAAVVLLRLDRSWLERRGGRVDREPVPPTAAPAQRETSATGAATAERAVEPSPAEDSPATAPAAARVRVEGTVRTRGGAIVTDGEVWLSVVDLRAWGLDAERWRALDEGERRELRYPEPPAAIGAGGRFGLEIPVPSMLCAAVVKPLLGVRNVQFLETDVELGELLVTSESLPRLELQVDEGGTLSGIVVDKVLATPIAGARVVNPWWHDEWSDWGSTTDDSGRFRIAGIDPDVAAAGGAELVADADGYVERRIRTPAPELGIHVSGIRIELERGIVVRGRCIGSSADVRAGLDLVLHSVDPAPDPGAVVRRVEFLAETSTDDDGSFVFQAVPATRRAWLEDENVVPALASRELDLLREQANVVLELPRAIAISDPNALPGFDPNVRSIHCGVFEPLVGGGRSRSLLGSRMTYAQVGIPLRMTVFELVEHDGVDRSLVRMQFVRTIQECESQAGDALTADELVARVVVPLRSDRSDPPVPCVGCKAGLGCRLLLALNDASGRPLAGFRVGIFDRTVGRLAMFATDPSGRVGLEVDLGRHFLTLRVAGFETEILEVRAHEPCTASLELTLRPLSD